MGNFGSNSWLFNYRLGSAPDLLLRTISWLPNTQEAGSVAFNGFYFGPASTGAISGNAVVGFNQSGNLGSVGTPNPNAHLWNNSWLYKAQLGAYQDSLLRPGSWLPNTQQAGGAAFSFYYFGNPNGIAAPAQGAQTVAASGTVTAPITGTGAPAQAAQSVAATGNVISPVTSTGATAQAAQTATAAGAETIGSIAATAQAAQTTSATAAETMSGTAAVAQAGQTVNAVGSEAIQPVTSTGATAQAAQTASAHGSVSALSSGTAIVACVARGSQVSGSAGTAITVVVARGSQQAGNRGTAIVVMVASGASQQTPTVILHFVIDPLDFITLPIRSQSIAD